MRVALAELAAGRNRGAVLDGIVDEFLDVLERLARDDRAVRHALVEAVTDLVGADDFLQFLDELVVDRVLHEDAVGAHAGLARVAVLRRCSTRRRQLQVCVVEHDDRGVAAKLHRQALERIGALLRQDLADARRSGERQLAHDRVRAHFVTDRARVVRRQNVEQSRGQSGPIGKLGQRCHRQWCFLWRLGYHRAADGKRGRDLAGEHRRREIPGRDRRAHADRLLDHDAATVRERLRQDVAIDTFAFLGEPLDERGSIDHLAPGLGQDLALLDRHENAEIVNVLHDELVPVPEHTGALDRRLRGPGFLCHLRRFDRTAGLGCTDIGHLGDDFVRRGIQDLEGRAVVGVDPFAVDVGLGPEEGGITERPVYAGDFLECMRHDCVLQNLGGTGRPLCHAGGSCRPGRFRLWDDLRHRSLPSRPPAHRSTK